jgi:hypothetical protein
MHARITSKGGAKDPSVASVTEICASQQIPREGPIPLLKFLTDF